MVYHIKTCSGEAGVRSGGRANRNDSERENANGQRRQEDKKGQDMARQLRQLPKTNKAFLARREKNFIGKHIPAKPPNFNITGPISGSLLTIE